MNARAVSENVLVAPIAAEPRLAREDLDAAGAVLRSGWLTMGPRTAELETGCASRLGAATAVAVSSGAAALHLALDGLGIGPGDEVVVSAWGAMGAAGGVRAARATPVPAGVISPDVPVLDPIAAAQWLTPRTRAVVAVHPWGHAAPVAELQALCSEHGVALVEYAPCGLGITIAGRPAGTFGVAGCFGLLPGGPRAGEAAGLLIAADGALAAHARSRRSHAMTSGTWARHTGNADAYDVEALGFNHRPDELRSALLLSRLSRHEDELALRRALARTYRERLAGSAAHPAFPLADLDAAAPSSFAVVVEDGARRDAAAAALAAQRIEAFAGDDGAPLLLLPLHGAMRTADAERVADVVTKALA